MSGFGGFNSGCPGEAMRGEPPYVNALARFQADGEILEPEQAGQVEPDSIRVTPVDDYMATTYRDRLYTFSEENTVSEIARKDPTIPEGNIRTLSESETARLRTTCNSCENAGGRCPVLELMIEKRI